MAATDFERVVRLTEADVQGGLALTDEARWNQVAADWDLMLARGRAFGLRGADGSLRASAVALPYGRVGWISMVLVTQTARRRGHATRLVEAAAEHLEGLGHVPVLDATPEGESVYVQMGFERQRSMTRWSGQGGTISAPDDGIRRARAADLDWIAALDREAFDAGRAPILEDLLTRPGAMALVSDNEDGVVLSRRGSRAVQLGPVIARGDAVGLSLLRAGIAALTGPVFVDAFDNHSALSDLLRRSGFVVQRPFARMERGGPALPGRRDLSFVAAGPELG